MRDEILPEIDRVLSQGDIILRDDLEKFETNLAAFVGTKYAVGVNSGTDALVLALRALDIGKGDEVITVSHTFQATIYAIKAVGATPVLVDIDTRWLMDLEKVEKDVPDRGLAGLIKDCLMARGTDEDYQRLEERFKKRVP